MIDFIILNRKKGQIINGPTYIIVSPTMKFLYLSLSLLDMVMLVILT